MQHKDEMSLTDRVLDAAEAVVVRQGIGALTLDAVAAKAGISKGGLLHHFSSKDRLIEAMVQRCATQWRACAMELYQDAPPGPGRMAKAIIRHIADAQSWTAQCQQSSSAVFAALVQNPKLIEPMRGVYAELRDLLKGDGLPPGVGETVIAAVDGLWLYRVLGLATVDQDLMDRIRAVLEPLVERGDPERGDPGAATPPPIPAKPARAGTPAPVKPAPRAAGKSALTAGKATSKFRKTTTTTKTSRAKPGARRADARSGGGSR